MEYELFKNRSYRGVISKGFGLYFSHFRLFFKASWMMAILFAIVFAALEMLLSVEMPALSATIMKQELVLKTALTPEIAQRYLLAIGTVPLLILLLIVAEALTAATVLNKLKEHQDTNKMTQPRSWFSVSRRLMGRTLKGYLLTILVILIPVLLIAALATGLHLYFPTAQFTIAVTAFLLCVCLALFSLPLIYLFMKYVLNPGTGYFKMFSKSYATGLRHRGHIFASFLTGGMLVSVLAGICCLPAFILAISHWLSQEGFLNGDPLGMPDYISLLTACTLFVTGFSLVYIVMPMLHLAYYLYGSIEAYEKEKNKLDI